MHQSQTPLSPQKVVEANVPYKPIGKSMYASLASQVLTMKALVHHLNLPSLCQTNQTPGTPYPLCGKSKTQLPLAETLVTLQPSPTLPSTEILAPLLEDREGKATRNTRLTRPEKDPIIHSTTSSSSYTQGLSFTTAFDKGPSLTNTPLAGSCLESASAIAESSYFLETR